MREVVGQNNKPRSDKLSLEPGWADKLVLRVGEVHKDAEAAEKARHEQEAAKAALEKKQREEAFAAALVQAKVTGREIAQNLQKEIVTTLQSAAEKGRLTIEIQVPISLHFPHRHTPAWELSEIPTTTFQVLDRQLASFFRKNNLTGFFVKNMQLMERHEYGDSSTCVDGGPPESIYRVDSVDRWYTLVVRVRKEGDEALPRASSEDEKKTLIPQFWRAWELRRSYEGNRPKITADGQSAGGCISAKYPMGDYSMSSSFRYENYVYAVRTGDLEK